MEARGQASIASDADEAFVLGEGGCNCGHWGSVSGSGRAPSKAIRRAMTPRSERTVKASIASSRVPSRSR